MSVAILLIGVVVMDGMQVRGCEGLGCVRRKGQQ